MDQGKALMQAQAHLKCPAQTKELLGLLKELKSKSTALIFLTAHIKHKNPKEK